MRSKKLKWNVDLTQHADMLLNRPGDPRFCPIDVELLCNIVPELNELNNSLNSEGWTMYKPKTMTLPPNAWGGIHVDSATNMDIIDLGFNIPIINGPNMITRWYNLDNISMPTYSVNWSANQLKEGYHQTSMEAQWFKENADWLVAERCVETMILDGTYLFYSGDPHNVDGRHSNTSRSMLSIRWINLVTEELMTWNNCDIFDKYL